MRKGDVVRVRWWDIVSELSADRLSESIEAIAIGVVECQRGRDLKLKSGWYVDEKEWPAKDGVTIPKGCVKSVEVLCPTSKK